MNALQIFENPEFGRIRTVEIDGAPWLVGKDVAQALGYQNTNKAMADHVDDDDKMQGDGVTIRDPMGREQHPTIINESGLYSLVLSSKLPTAKKFRRWVTNEVLPSVRKHGAYMTGDTLEKMISSPEFGIRLLEELDKERKQRQALEEQAQKDLPKVIFADAVSVSDDGILIGALAKIIKQNGVEIGQKRLFEWMRNYGYLMKNGIDRNLPTQKAMEMKLFKIKERTINNPDGSVRITKTVLVTGKGQQHFINKFLEGKKA